MLNILTFSFAFFMFTCAEQNQPCGVKQTGRIHREAEEAKQNSTAIVSTDLDRTDNRFHGFNVLKGFHGFAYRTVRWATSEWNL